jgi:hypothetical protein
MRRLLSPAWLALVCLAALPLVAACVPLQPAAPAPLPELQVENARNADISASRAGDAVIVEVRSETGIGSASIALPEDDSVREIILRLHLKGLENLTFSAPDGHVVTVAVSSGDTIVRQMLHTPDSSIEEEIRAGSPWWMETGIISGEGGVEPTIPLEGGHFDIAVPRAFLREGGSAFDLAWVDFYR